MKVDILIFVFKDNVYIDNFYLPFSQDEYKLDRKGNDFYLNTSNVEGDKLGNFCHNDNETVLYNFFQVPDLTFFLSVENNNYWLKYLCYVVCKEQLGLLTEFIPELNFKFENRNAPLYVKKSVYLIKLKTYFDFSNPLIQNVIRIINFN